MIFIEIKTSNQPRVKAGFEGFFFALTESEIAAADQLGQRHKVSLFNRLSGELPITSVSEILDRSKSLNWQVSVQL
jgi:diketogulonate reductase-like aldo/keto reductase